MENKRPNIPKKNSNISNLYEDNLDALIFIASAELIETSPLIQPVHLIILAISILLAANDKSEVALFFCILTCSLIYINHTHDVKNPNQLTLNDVKNKYQRKLNHAEYSINNNWSDKKLLDNYKIYKKNLGLYNMALENKFDPNTTVVSALSSLKEEKLSRKVYVNELIDFISQSTNIKRNFVKELIDIIVDYVLEPDIYYKTRKALKLKK